jgi:gamma-glutamyltranspeptidase/glutathione hydrolase
VSTSRRSARTIRARSRRTAFVLALLVAGASLACRTLDPEVRDPFPLPSTGVVAGPDKRATDAALAMLDRGGNAADASVAAALVLAVVRPGAGPLGGGGVALWVGVDPRDEPRLLDFRETVPAGLDPARLRHENGEWAPELLREGGLAVGVPGGWNGLHTFQRALGRLSFAEVARPAIELARRGVLPDAALLERIATDLPFAASLLRIGPLPVDGVPFRQESLARFLEELVARGPAGLAAGPRGDALCRAVAQRGGVLERADLTAYRPVWSAACAGWFRSLEIVTAPPPSLGGALFLESLLVLDGFPLDAETERADQAAAEMGQVVREESRGLSGRAVHWAVEALRLASEDVRELARAADPDAELDTRLLPEHVVSERVFIGESAHAGAAWIDAGPETSGGESSLVVLDRAGNAVALALGLGARFGSGVFVPETGFFLNGALAAFHDGDRAGLAARVVPGARASTWRTPVVVRDGSAGVAWVLAAAGGMRAPQALLQVFLRAEVHGQTLFAAIGAPRFALAPADRTLDCEPGWDPALRSRLEGRAHVLVESPGDYGMVQAIHARPAEVPAATCDPRWRGSAGAQRARPREPQG